MNRPKKRRGVNTRIDYKGLIVNVCKVWKSKSMGIVGGSRQGRCGVKKDYFRARLAQLYLGEIQQVLNMLHRTRTQILNYHLIRPRKICRTGIFYRPTRMSGNFSRAQQEEDSKEKTRVGIRKPKIQICSAPRGTKAFQPLFDPVSKYAHGQKPRNNRKLFSPGAHDFYY